MPTLNSEQTLEKALQSVKNQDFPSEQIEILLIDGGSTDTTLLIAKKFGCKVFHNPNVVPEYAKFIGLNNARGKFAVFLDSDEELINNKSFSKKVYFLSKHKEVKNVITAGLITPLDYPRIGEYINSYGDPFSAFMYNINGGDYVPDFSRKYTTKLLESDYVLVKFEPQDIIPICDGGGHFFDLNYLKENANISKVSIASNVFNIMVEHTKVLLTVRNDFTRHYATIDFSKYLNKIRWRVVSNLFEGQSNAAGYIEKEKHQPAIFRLKKLVFIPFAFSVIFPLIKAIFLAIRHKNTAMLYHFPLTIYTAGVIVIYMLMKIIGITPKIGAYGKK